jgi:hypothetical protein
VPVVIGEIVTEVVVAPGPAAAAPSGVEPMLSEEVIEVIVRRAVERMREVLRREWDR